MKQVIYDEFFKGKKAFDPVPIWKNNVRKWFVYVTIRLLTYRRDALEIDWKKQTWLNPPFSRIGEFMHKAVKELKKGHRSVFLCPARMNSKYWAEYVYPYVSEMWFIQGRINFNPKKYDGGLPLPICLLYFTEKKSRYETPTLVKRGKTLVNHFQLIVEKENTLFMLYRCAHRWGVSR